MLNTSKQQLRQQLLRIRQEIPASQRRLMNDAIREKLLALPEVINAGTLFCFISFADEVDTHAVIRQLQQQGKIIVVPKTLKGGKMAAIPLGSWDDLEADGFGVPVPRSSRPYMAGIDTCLTPGLGFSPLGQRLGYGRGYYDDWFTENRVAHKVGVGFDCQVLDEIPVDDTDVPLDKIVTEKDIYIVNA